MYLDYINANYTEQEQLINRDKNHLGKIIQDRVTKDIEEIVERWYKLDDIRLVEEGIFYDL